MNALSFSSSTAFWTNAFEISTIVTFQFSFVSTMHVSMAASEDTVGELAYSFVIYPHCLVPPAICCAFKIPSCFLSTKK
jgi:hypothetical protein